MYITGMCNTLFRKRDTIHIASVPQGAQVDINGKKFEQYFPLQLQRDLIMAPLQKFSNPEKIDLIVRVKGGGLEAQAVATRLGISRALVQEDENVRGDLKELGYLTRDPRKRERKKYGRKGARKRFQFSKR